MKLLRILPAAVATLAAALSVCSCDRQKPTTTSTSGIATVYTDPSFQNIVDDEVNVYEYIYRDANIIPMYENEKACMDSLIAGATKAIVISRPLKEDEAEYFKAKGTNARCSKIAVDAIAVIVNPANTVDQLSVSELAEILTGKYTQWGDVEPSKLGKITVVFDHQASSTVKYMRDSVMSGRPFGDNVGAQGSPKAVFDYVAENRGAIGFVGVNWISTDMRTTDLPQSEKAAAKAQMLQDNDTVRNEFNTAVKVLKLRRDDDLTAVKPYQYYIYTAQYPLFRPVYMIITATNGTLAHGFYSFVTGYQGQKIIQSSGILPYMLQNRQHVELVSPK